MVSERTARLAEPSGICKKTWCKLKSSRALPVFGSLCALLIAVSSDGQTQAPATSLASASTELGLSISSLTAPIPVCIQVRLTNVSDHSVVVNGRMAHTELSLIVKAESGEVLKWLPPLPPSPLTSEDFVVLKPSEDLVKEICNWTRSLSSLLSLGGYAIQARYSNAEESPSDNAPETPAWKGALLSNTLAFSVDEE